MKKRPQWQWFVWGKHPGLQDFVWAGSHTPLFQRFTKWVDNGFARIKTDSRLRTRHCSWRFWTKGAGDDILCGLVRNSCDTHGRSFPLLHIGTGVLPDWPNNCSMLPFAFEAVWKNFEYAASARFDTVRQLDDSLQLVQQPTPNWRAYQQRIYNTANMTGTAQCTETVQDTNCLLKIDCKLPENLPYDLQFCQRVMAAGDNHSPPAVFIGEIEERVAVALITHALTPSDFVWLWRLAPDNAPPARQQAQRG